MQDFNLAMNVAVEVFLTSSRDDAVFKMEAVDRILIFVYVNTGEGASLLQLCRPYLSITLPARHVGGEFLALGSDEHSGKPVRGQRLHVLGDHHEQPCSHPGQTEGVVQGIAHPVTV